MMMMMNQIYIPCEAHDWHYCTYTTIGCLNLGVMEAVLTMRLLLCVTYWQCEYIIESKWQVGIELKSENFLKPFKQGFRYFSLHCTMDSRPIDKYAVYP